MSVQDSRGNDCFLASSRRRASSTYLEATRVGTAAATAAVISRAQGANIQNLAWGTDWGADWGTDWGTTQEGERAKYSQVKQITLVLPSVLRQYLSKLFEPIKLNPKVKHCRRGPDSEVDLVFECGRRRRCNSGVCQDPEADLVSIPEGKALDLTLAR